MRETRQSAHGTHLYFGSALARFVEHLAVIGGIFVLALALFTALGISWRTLVGRGLRGDFEIVEILSAYAVFLFFPYAQSVRQHIAVDFVTDRLPGRMRGMIGPANDLVVALVSGFITWRIIVGAFDAHARDDVTMMLRLPILLAYLPAIAGWGLMTLIAALQGLGRMRDVEKP